LSRDHASPETAREVLERFRVVAVVGLSPDPGRPSHGVARYLQQNGYRIIPIRPGAEEILGERAYPSLLDVPREEGVEVVDVFRRSEFVSEHVDEALQIGARALWLQDGVVDQPSADRAAAGGLFVVMNRCMARDHSTMFGGS